ncbi:hypothetical protein BN1221_01332c [Brenneria goodwinii]|uniref:Uncharacterized protein n=1 Tax=Brenneria goodwinii TaxID=1109412 RepID=A0A0G4JSI7_9GAMM|nr:hypothetical protein BN1221_01332c [Brenneria goodwinii]
MLLILRSSLMRLLKTFVKNNSLKKFAIPMLLYADILR